MVFMRLPEEKKDGFKAFMAEQNILISPPKAAFRLVLHKDISSDAIQLFAEKIRAYMAL